MWVESVRRRVQETVALWAQIAVARRHLVVELGIGEVFQPDLLVRT